MEWILDVAEAEFQEHVIEASKARPVLVDFWASWCSPCQMLAPILERLAEKFQGGFRLARINVEEAPALAHRYQIHSIPLVVMFRDGKAVDQFVGLLPESQIRGFLEKYCPTQDRALIEAAKAAWKKRDEQEMRRCLDGIDPLSSDAEVASNLRTQLRFWEVCNEYGGLEACRRQIEENPNDLERQYQLGCCLAAEEHFREALEVFLSVVAAKRSFKEEASRKAMIDIFNIVGARSPLADEYRTKLARTIF